MSNDRSTATRDYLKSVPIEIWREIFLQETPFIAVPTILKPHCEFREPDDIPRHGIIVKNQHRRAQLLTICKSFYWLTKSLLYTEVGLAGSTRQDLFITTVSTKTPGLDSPAKWTKFIYLNLSPYYEQSRTIAPPMKLPSIEHNQLSVPLFPQLISLFIFQTLRSTNHVHSPILSVLAARIHTITWQPDIWGYCDESALYLVCSQNPELRRLNLCGPFSRRLRNTATRTTTISSVQHITIERMFANDFNGPPKIKCPSLQSLHVKLSASMEWVGQFIKDCCPNITDLKLAILSPKEPTRPFHIPDDLFTTCTQLKHLSYNASLIFTPREANPSLHHNLASLLLFMYSPTHACNFDMTANYFSRSKFPNISTITLLFGRVFGAKDLEGFRSHAANLFPGVTLEIEVIGKYEQH
jgi:hypothetical protein